MNQQWTKSNESKSPSKSFNLCTNLDLPAIARCTFTLRWPDRTTGSGGSLGTANWSRSQSGIPAAAKGSSSREFKSTSFLHMSNVKNLFDLKKD